MLTRQRFVFIVAFVTIVHLVTTDAAAQPMLFSPTINGSPAEAGPPLPPSVEEKRAENAEQLRIAMRKLDASGTTDSATSQEVAYFQARDAVLSQQDIVNQQIKDLEARKIELESQLKSPPPDDKQYKFADLDRLKDDVAAEQARTTLLNDKLVISKSSLKSAQAALEDCEVKRRQAQTDYEAGKNTANANELAISVDRAKQSSTLAGETLALRTIELKRDELAKAALKLAVQVRQAQVERVSPKVAFTEADYKEQIASIRKTEANITASLATAQGNLVTTLGHIRNSEKQLEGTDGDLKAKLTEIVATNQRTKAKLTEEIDSLTQRQRQYIQLRTAWDHRYEIASIDKKNTNDEVWGRLKRMQDDTQKVLDELAPTMRNQIFKMRDTRSSLTSVIKKAEAAAKGPPEIAYQIGLQQTILEETLKIYEKNLVTIETSRRVHEKLLDELAPAVEAVTPKAIALGVWYQIKQLWVKELVPIGDQSLTYGKAVTCITILAVGWMLSRFTSGVFANRFLKRFRLSKDATSVIRSLVFYGMLMFVTLTALNTINVPLTAFTILGGAFAIGIGFGSQTLINNFIGGLIMLAERPVRLGERITFKDIDGVVEDVGFRCTKIRTQADHLVTIPNSTLVNESIENVDRRRTIRRNFNVAVTYNVSREQLEAAVQAIRDILEERDIRERIHPIVGFEELAPQVHFVDFATESLNIHVSYWYAPIDNAAFADHTERVNFRIMEEFDRLGVQFAFPSKTAYVTKSPRPGRRGDSFAA